MPKMGDLAAQDKYSDLELAPYGVGSPAETANAPSGMGSILKGAYEYLGDLAKRSFGASEQMRQGGSYNPAPIMEAAMLPMTGAVAGTGPGGFAVGAGPIKAYHASPHDFEKFDLSKIGTGEGAQVYGHGLYFAEHPAVSGQGGQYWQQFQSRFPGSEGSAAELLKRHKFDREAALAANQREIDQYIENYGNRLGKDKWHDRVFEEMQGRDKLLRSDKPIGPRTYEVDIKADPKHMLDWDKPLAEQSPHVKSFIDQMKGPPVRPGQPATGEEIYRALAARVGEKKSGDTAPWAASSFVTQPDKVRASAMLNEAGIPGIKYLDQGSRGLQNADEIRQQIARVQGVLADNPQNANAAGLLRTYQAQLADAERATSNYVIFDPTIIDIRKKFGIAGTTAGTMGALAAQDTYKPEEKL